MNSLLGPLGNQEALRRALIKTDALLLDFDGPVCSIFSGIPASAVARQLRTAFVASWNVTLPFEVGQTEDPFDVFRYAAVLGQDEAVYVEGCLRTLEVKAASLAIPSGGAHDLIHRWHSSGRKTGIVSNNSYQSVMEYLEKWHLDSFIDCVSARDTADSAVLKPNVALLERAAAELSVEPRKCTFVGDSVTDIEASRRFGSISIGYVNRAPKVTLLAAADHIIFDMGLISSLLDRGGGERE